jgi:phosphoenolpyruvate synthase/pyruvate phosphate dikinase
MNIYSFGMSDASSLEGPEVLGGKGAGLVWMDNIGVNVPPGFVLPCSLMAEYEKAPKTVMKAIAKAIKPYLKRMSDMFGYMPLVSVRSGARVSLPGMMDTILNVGMEYNSQVWIDRLGAQCAANSELRLVTMFGNVVKGIDKAEFKQCATVDAARIKYTELSGEQFPDAKEQLLEAIEAVFKSWNNERAKFFRKMNNIPDDWGTAVVVQAMVFGNLNDNSGTGVLFTRNPQSGENALVGEFAVNAQGEDVVDGSTTPMQLAAMQDWNPDVAKELADVAERLEKAKGDVQDVEFTVQDGKLYILQTRTAKREPRAALRIAVEMYEAELIPIEDLRKRITPREFDEAQQCVLEPSFEGAVFTNGTPACGGIATGKIVRTSQAAIDCVEPCILVTQETNPDDIAGMYAAWGIVTMTGGHTCHAAVVARGMNKPCIVGVGMDINKFKTGDVISIDGTTGRIWAGEVPVIDGTNNEYAKRYLNILRKNLGYIPIVSGADAKGAKTVMYNPSGNAVNLYLDIGNVLALLTQVDHLYVDCRLSRVDDAELKFYQLFLTEKPSKNNTSPKGYAELCKAMGASIDSEIERSKITVLGNPAVPKGMHKIVEVESLEDLILCEGEAILGGLGLESAAVKRILDWRKNEPDFRFVSYGSIVEGAKSFASDVLALQSK